MNGEQDINQEFVTSVRDEMVNEVKEEVAESRKESLKSFPGTIVPDNLPLKDDQIHESEFLDRWAWAIVDSATQHVAHTETLSKVRYGEYFAIRSVLQNFRDEIIGPLVPLDTWLRRKFGISPDEKVTPDEFLNQILGLVDSDMHRQIQERVANLSEEEIKSRYSGEGPEEDDDIYMQLASHQKVDIKSAGWLMSSISSLCGPDKIIPGSIPSSFGIGNLVHLMIQEHYVFSHPNDTVLTDARMFFPGGGSETVRQVSQGKSGYSLEAVLIDFARTLRKVAINGSKAAWVIKRPDILNINRREVYEIKPRRRFIQGIYQLNLLYIPALNAAADILAKSNPTFNDTPFRPGIYSEWRPLPIYPIPPDLFAVTCIDPFVPGLIIYDLFRIKQFPVVEPIPVKVPAGEGIPVMHVLLFLLLILLLILFILLLLEPIPGDEVLPALGILRILQLLDKVPAFIRVPAFAF